MHNKFSTLIIVVMLALLATQVAANNEVLAPDDNCPNNLTLLPANTEVYFAPYTQQGEVSNGFVDPATVTNLHTLYMSYIQDELPVSSLLTTPPENAVIEEAPTPIVLTGNYVCMSDGITGIFRETTQNSWIIEKIIIEELALTDEIIEQFTIELLEPLEMAPEDDAQLNFVPPTVIDDLQAPDEPAQPLDLQAVDTLPVLHNARFNFWQIYNQVSVGTAEELLAPDTIPQPQNYCGEYTAPSYLSVGMQAEMNTYEYVYFPQSGDLSDDTQGNWLDQNETAIFDSEYGIDFMIQMRQEASIHTQPVSFDFVPPVVATSETIFAPPVYGAPIATIKAGPFCGNYEIVDNHPCPENGTCEYEEPISDRYATWWQIEVTIHDETYIGWYPENMTEYAWWLWEEEGIFDRVASTYLLIPFGQAMTVMGEDDCEPLPASRFVAGMDVQPANGAMNIRDDANGGVIGRVEADSIMTLVGEDDCDEGVRWREVIFHSGSVSRGWIAENDATNFYIAPYLPPVETVEPEATRPADSGQPTGSTDNNRPQATPEPEPTSSTPACDPATGMNC